MRLQRTSVLPVRKGRCLLLGLLRMETVTSVRRVLNKAVCVLERVHGIYQKFYKVDFFCFLLVKHRWSVLSLFSQTHAKLDTVCPLRGAKFVLRTFSVELELRNASLVLTEKYRRLDQLPRLSAQAVS